VAYRPVPLNFGKHTLSVGAIDVEISRLGRKRRKLPRTIFELFDSGWIHVKEESIKAGDHHRNRDHLEEDPHALLALAKGNFGLVAPGDVLGRDQQKPYGTVGTGDRDLVDLVDSRLSVDQAYRLFCQVQGFAGGDDLAVLGGEDGSLPGGEKVFVDASDYLVAGKAQESFEGKVTSDTSERMGVFDVDHKGESVEDRLERADLVFEVPHALLKLVGFELVHPSANVAANSSPKL
jgi:hypothetical protein